MNKNDINTFYTFLQSQQTAQQFLKKCYEEIDGIDAEAKSYENCSAFLYYLDHGTRFYESGKSLNIVMQPILFFYGLTHLIKASLLTKRPNYPESTSMLAHGVSTRKRKKKQYTFLDDEVKIQHNGLFPYFSEHLYQIKSFQKQKFKMNDLFSVIPEMTPLYNFEKKEKLIIVGTIGATLLHFPIHLLDSYHLTTKAFIQRIHHYLPSIKNTVSDKTEIRIELTTPLVKSSGPFLVHMADFTIYFPISRDRFLPFSEVMVQYLLLYNLSMICRYETEWWGDLIVLKPEIDYPFISHFLKITSEKVPLLLGQQLFELYQKN